MSPRSTDRCDVLRTSADVRRRDSPRVSPLVSARNKLTTTTTGGSGDRHDVYASDFENRQQEIASLVLKRGQQGRLAPLQLTIPAAAADDSQGQTQPPTMTSADDHVFKLLESAPAHSRQLNISHDVTGKSRGLLSTRCDDACAAAAINSRSAPSSPFSRDRKQQFDFLPEVMRSVASTGDLRVTTAGYDGGSAIRNGRDVDDDLQQRHRQRRRKLLNEQYRRRRRATESADDDVSVTAPSSPPLSSSQLQANAKMITTTTTIIKASLKSPVSSPASKSRDTPGTADGDCAVAKKAAASSVVELGRIVTENVIETREDVIVSVFDPRRQQNTDDDVTDDGVVTNSRFASVAFSPATDAEDVTTSNSLRTHTSTLYLQPATASDDAVTASTIDDAASTVESKRITSVPEDLVHALGGLTVGSASHPVRRAVDRGVVTSSVDDAATPTENDLITTSECDLRTRENIDVITSSSGDVPTPANNDVITSSGGDVPTPASSDVITSSDGDVRSTPADNDVITSCGGGATTSTADKSEVPNLFSAWFHVIPVSTNVSS